MNNILSIFTNYVELQNIIKILKTPQNVIYTCMLLLNTLILNMLKGT